MTGNITARQMALSHFLIAKRLHKKSALDKPSALKHLENQLTKHGQDSTPGLLGAFTAYWLNSQKPFKAGNTTTAVVLGFAVAGVRATDVKIRLLAMKLREGAGVEELEAIISGG